MNRRPRSGFRWPSPRAWFLGVSVAVAALLLGHVTAPNPLLPHDWITSSQAAAGATNYFLKVDGISGDVIAKGHAGDIQLNSWQFAFTRSVSGAGGASAGKVDCSDFTFATLLSSASPDLLRAALTGPITNVRLSGNLDTGRGGTYEFLGIDFTDVFFDQYNVSSDGGLPVETISFTYGALVVSYRTQKPDGTLGNPVVTAWDCTRNSGGTPPPPTATTTTLTSSSTNPTYGDSIVLTATVAAGSVAPDRGEVTFSEGATVLCQSVALSAGSATCPVGPLAAGTHTYTADYTALSKFAPSSGTLTLTVNPAALTVTAGDTTKVYGQPNPTFTVTYSGFINGDDPTSLGGTLAFTTSATDSSAAGAYSVTPSGLTSSNYTITFVAGTLTVTPAPLIVTADDKAKVYGQSNPTFTASYAGFVNTDTAASLGGSLTFTTAATAASAVGAYDVMPGGLTSSNYTITFVKGTLTITPAPLTVTADNKSKVYGQPNPTFTASYAGFVNGDAPGSLGGSLAFTTAATTASPAGSYGVTPGGLTSSNYTITFADGTLTVAKAPLTVMTNDSTRMYGSPDAFTVSYSGFVLTDTPAVLGGTLIFLPDTSHNPVGAYLVTPAGLTASNYDITFVAGTLTITNAPLTVKADDLTRPYGSPNPTLTVTYTGFVLGETASSPGVLGGTLAISTTAQLTSLPGAYPITVGGLTAVNYNLTFVGGTLTVAKAQLSVIANDASRDYGDRNPRFSVTYVGFVLGQGPAVLGGDLTITTVATKTSPAGTYAIVPAGLTAANYQITFVNGTLTVTKVRLKVIVLNASRSFGAPNPPFSVRYVGFVLDDTATTPGVLVGTLSFSTADQTSPVGRYPIIASGLTAPNYDITFMNGTLTIRPVESQVTVTIDATGYTDANPFILVKATVSPVALAGSQQSGRVVFYVEGDLVASQPLGADGTASSLVRIEESPGEADIHVVFISSNPNFTGAQGSNGTQDDESGPGRDRSESHGFQ